jgi:uncharacterized membrane protein (UPF0127 family)
VRSVPRRLWLIAPLAAGVLVVGCGRAAFGQEQPAPADGGDQPPPEPVGDDGAPVDAPAPMVEAQPQAVFPTVAVNLEVARTEEERELGLGGHAPLGETDGMLFIFERSGYPAFWMKGMTFGLDMMWLENGQVVHLERDVPPPGPTDTDRTLPILVPAAAATYVLEVNPGFADRHGITVGTPVELRGL